MIALIKKSREVGSKPDAGGQAGVKIDTEKKPIAKRNNSGKPATIPVLLPSSSIIYILHFRLFLIM